MKVLFKHLIQGYTGKADDMSIYYDPRLQRVIMRRTPKVVLGERHTVFANIAKNLKRLEVSSAYRQDMIDYLAQYNRLRENREKIVCGWYNLFTKLMHCQAKEAGCDLQTITKAQIYADNLPCISVKTAVEAGLIPRVANYSRLVNMM